MTASLLSIATLSKVTAGGVIVVALSLIALLIKSIGPWSKQRSDAEEAFRNGLLKREGDLTERVNKLEGAMTRQQIRHNAERALDRHRLNNITACFDALMLLVETSPEKASEAVAKVRQMRADQMRAEAEEKAIIRAAEIAAEECESDHDGN